MNDILAVGRLFEQAHEVGQVSLAGQLGQRAHGGGPGHRIGIVGQLKNTSELAPRALFPQDVDQDRLARVRRRIDETGRLGNDLIAPELQKGRLKSRRLLFIGRAQKREEILGLSGAWKSGPDGRQPDDFIRVLEPLTNVKLS